MFSNDLQKGIPHSTQKIFHEKPAEFRLYFILFGVRASVVMKFVNLDWLALLVCILTKKIECVPDCDPGLFYSVDIPGCIGCPANCSAQDNRDVARCKEACGRCLLNTL